jgi:hypothetical protein
MKREMPSEKVGIEGQLATRAQQRFLNREWSEIPGSRAEEKNAALGTALLFPNGSE